MSEQQETQAAEAPAPCGDAGKNGGDQRHLHEAANPGAAPLSRNEEHLAGLASFSTLA